MLGQRCRDLLLQLYLQRPEVRVPVPEVLLQSEGATSSSICKVRDMACCGPVAYRPFVEGGRPEACLAHRTLPTASLHCVVR